MSGGPPSAAHREAPTRGAEREEGHSVAAAVPPTMMLGYLDLALRGTLEYERYSHLYLSPWWELPEVPEGARAWKRAVLERIPLRGAEHWGHLYLVVRMDTSSRPRFSILGRSWDGRVVAEAPGEYRLSIRRGAQTAEIVVHPSSPERAEKVRSFAHEVEERFRRQMD